MRAGTAVGTLLAVASASALHGCATSPIGALDETWFACSRNRQCEIFEDPTCARVPINKRYADAFALHVRTHAAREVATQPCAQSPLRYRAVCALDRCTSEVRGRRVVTRAWEADGARSPN